MTAGLRLVISLVLCGSVSGPATQDSRLGTRSQAAPTYLQAILEGRGSPLVMLGGGAAGANEFQPHARVLAEDYRVIRLQTINAERAQTRESLPAGYGVRTESAAMARTLDRLKIDTPVDLVGHSFGALVALDYALDHPHRIRTLSLMEPPAIWLLQPPERPSAEELRTAHGLTTEILSAVAEHRDDPDRLQRFQRPVLIIMSAQTDSLQRRIDDLLASHLPLVERVRLAGDHSSLRSRPDAFVAELRRFLEGHRFDERTTEIEARSYEPGRQREHELLETLGR